jgi:hypothetical protein
MGNAINKNQLALQQFTEKHKILTPIIFWGFLALLVWWLMARNNNTPDLRVPDNGQMEDICPNGYPC